MCRAYVFYADHTKSARALIEAPYHVRFVIQHVRYALFLCRVLVFSYSSDIGVYRDYSGLGNR